MTFNIPDTRPFYGGAHHDSLDNGTFESVNPATEELIAIVPVSAALDVEAAVSAAEEAYKEWQNIGALERGRCVAAIADLVEEHAEELAYLDVVDSGRPLADAREDIEAVANLYRYFGGLSSKIEGATIPANNEQLVMTSREPFGVIAAITAWNYPLFNESAKIAPIIATGNACVLKPAEETPLVALRLAELIASVPGLPGGLVSVLNGPGDVTGELLVANSGVSKVTFTGSTQTARSILTNIAGNDIKGTTFELGGKAPVVVFPDANIDGAAKAIAFCGFYNQGQTCTAATRVIVHKDVHDMLIERIRDIADRIVVGDPFDEDTHLGPLASKAQYDKVRGYVTRAIERGEDLVFGGIREFERGFYVIPTMFDGVKCDSELFTDEIFGPVLCVTEFETLDEAISLANDSKYGLACGVWTKDICVMHDVASQMKCGIVWCNTLFSEYAGAPAGGYGNSGYGREFGKEAITEYTRVKTSWVSYDDAYWDWV